METLLTQKSDSNSSNNITTSITPARSTSGTWKKVFCQVMQLRDCFASIWTTKLTKTRPAVCLHHQSCREKLQQELSLYQYDMLNLMFAEWLRSRVGGGFLCHYLCPPHHIMSLPLTVKTTCKGSQAWHQGNMYIQSKVWTHILQRSLPLLVTLCCVFYLKYEYYFL